MYSVYNFARERFPDTQATWSYPTHALVTADEFVAFSSIDGTHRVPAVAEVSWDPSMGLVTARFDMEQQLHGVACGGRVIPTPNFNVLGFESWFKDRQEVRRNFSIAQKVKFGYGIEVVAVPLPDHETTRPVVMSNADIFIYEKVLRLTDAERIKRLGLIG